MISIKSEIKGLIKEIHLTKFKSRINSGIEGLVYINNT